MSMKTRRQTLHLITTAVWTASLGLVVADCIYDAHQIRVSLMFVLSVAVALTAADVVIAFLPQMPTIYLRGFQDGVESSRERPALAVVNDNCCTVTKLRPSHTSN